MVKSWGEAPGDVFVYDDEVIILGFPMAIYGLRYSRLVALGKMYLLFTMIPVYHLRINI